MERHLSRRLAVAGTALFAATLLAACGSENPGDDADTDTGQATAAPTASAPAPTASGSAGVTHSAADVSFVTGMLPHHRQAVEMAELATTKAANPLVKAMAARVVAVQNSEVATLTDWLREWGVPVPSEPADHGGHGDGVMSAQEMADLKTASGPAFDRMFLEMMIRHHDGAITLAGVEQQQGQHPGVKQFATKVIADQSAEMAQLKDLLNRL